MTQDSQITRTAFAQVPIQLLEQCSDRSLRGCLFVYLWLWHYAGIKDQAFPSVPRLAAECHMKPDDVRKALKWLAAQGWIKRIDRPGQTTLFHVRTEKEPRRTPAPKGVPLPRKGDTPRGVTLPAEPLPRKGETTPPPEGGPNKNQLTRTKEQDLEPPLPPAAPSAPDPAPPAVEKPAKANKSRFRPTQYDIPATLLPVALDLLGFWEGKAGAKTQHAWRLLLTELAKIQADVAGGTEVVRAQLQGATQAGWRSVTHANWHRYGRQSQGALPFGNGSSRRTSTSITHDSRLQVGEFLRANGLA
jgi:hypothetical protein